MQIGLAHGRRQVQLLLMPKAPPFTAQTAAEMARKSHVARALKRAATEAALNMRKSNPPQLADDMRRVRTLRQLDKLDVMIDEALDKSNTVLFLQLSSAKERLWKLVQPTAGQLKPSAKAKARFVPTVTAAPAATPQPVVSCGVKAVEQLNITSQPGAETPLPPA